jgi:hypothetical protein
MGNDLGDHVEALAVDPTARWVQELGGLADEIGLEPH